MKVKYKQDSKTDVSLYQRLPETSETQQAKQLRDIFSQVRDVTITIITEQHIRPASVQ